MARRRLESLTTFLKLRITEDLSADARYNLERIDSLIAQGFIVEIPDAVIRASGDVRITPGEGQSVIVDEGLIAFGPSYFDETRWYDDNRDNSIGFKAPDVLTVDTTYQLPDADGLAGEVLTTDGSGVLSWTIPSTGNEQQLASDWAAGTTEKTILHGFGTTDVEVLVYDKNTENFIGVEKIELLDSNTVKLSVVEAVAGLGYRIFIREVL